MYGGASAWLYRLMPGLSMIEDDRARVRAHRGYTETLDLRC